MFSGLGSHHASPVIDPQQDREPPPLPTVVLFPHEELHTDKSWPRHPPDLYKQYTNVNKPYDVKPEHLQALNVEVEDEVDLDTFIPPSSDGLRHLPPREWGKDVIPGTASRRNSAESYEIFAHNKYPLLSNGVTAPSEDAYVRFAAELVCDTDAGFRVVGKQKQQAGHKAPPLTHYRKFWGTLQEMSQYWDASMDTYFESRTRPGPPPRTKSGTMLFKNFHLGGHKQKETPLGPTSTTSNPQKRYRGRRTDTGANMPDHIRNDTIRNFIEPVSTAFGCSIAIPRKGPQLKVKNMLIPVTQSVVIWRNPQDKSQAKQGVLEGPLIGVQCRAATNFVTNERAATVDAAREIGGLLLLAQERDREGKPKEVPTEGKWYTTKPRWGGGVGGEFGGSDSGATDAGYGNGKKKPPQTTSAPGGNVTIQYKPSDEFVWKQLKPQRGLWEPNRTYLAVGKERSGQYDDVFMISSLYHHIALVKLTCHPLYLHWMTSGLFPTSQPDSTWYSPVVSRTRWYDLFNPHDRAEAMRGLWGTFSYLMRAGPVARRPVLGERQRSELGHHVFGFRGKGFRNEVKREEEESDEEETPRSLSLY